VRGSTRGESHGGLFLIDPERRTTHRPVDWNLASIEWREFEGDRGLRGLAVDGDNLYVASSSELLAFSKDLRLRQSWRHPYLRNAQDLCIWQRKLFVAAAGSDCVLAFDLDEQKFLWVMHIHRKEFQFIATLLEPDSQEGPLVLDKLHLTSVYCDDNGLYITGTNSGGMLHFSGKRLGMSAELPQGTRNARPFRTGILFNDCAAGVVRYCGRVDMAEDRALAIPAGSPEPGGRGLCVLSGSVIAVGSAPATVTFFDLPGNRQLHSVVLSKDANHSIHSLAAWPLNQEGSEKTRVPSALSDLAWATQREACQAAMASRA
jgi:hypothetical protein